MKNSFLLNLSKSHFFIFTGIIFLKALFLRYLLFQEIELTQTIVLELSYILIFTSLFELAKPSWKPVLYLILNTLFSILFLAVILYYSFFGRIVTYFALFQLGQVGTINESVSALLEPIYLLFFLDLVFLLVLLVFKKYPLPALQLNRKIILAVLLVLGVGVSAVNFNLHKDEAISNNVIAAQEKGILNYSALEIYYGPENLTAIETNVSVDNLAELKEEINRIKELEIVPEEERNYFNAAEGRNLIVIQVESMQNFPVGLDVDGTEVTPHLNKLLDESFYFPNTAQQTGPGNTSDAEFILNTSLYPVAFNPTSQTFGNKKFPSLPRLLTAENYKTLTFHADDISFWNRDELYPALGIGNYYYGEFFGKDDVIGIGPSDRVMFEKALPILRGHHVNDQPFYAQLIGLTSHHPFTLPEADRQLELPERFNNSLTGDYLVSINYMDTVINDFIEELKQEGIYENSVIAIYGDHFGLQQSAISENDVDLVSELLGREYRTMDRLNVPFIIHAPGITDEGQTFEKTSGQLDMMPTLANLLGISLNEQIVFGQDLLNHDSNLLGARYYLPIGSFWNDEVLFIPEKDFDDGNAYDLETDKAVEDYEQYRDDYDRILQLEKLSDEYMESLPEQ
ncbi:sulfatase [Planococcus donghaensis MPA1U2]|uniref:Sulfatase n=1 Tax=Planococcus donghaensis MPA1U2 TaxID=933115 RepID=E7RL99_9BACL|nr:LTA synthase family protein [Planococcus donghaensis]EGA88291.1 sulfatase [Planococcus donghaensis MPA1U2]